MCRRKGSGRRTCIQKAQREGPEGVKGDRGTWHSSNPFQSTDSTCRSWRGLRTGCLEFFCHKLLVTALSRELTCGDIAHAHSLAIPGSTDFPKLVLGTPVFYSPSQGALLLVPVGSRRQFRTTSTQGDIWQCVETLLVVPTGKKGVLQTSSR